MAAYTLANLLTFFREDLDDTETPYLWSDNQFYRYLDEAQKQFVRDTRYIHDATTAEICSIPVFAGREYIVFDERILEIKRAQLASTNRPLSLRNFNELDQNTHAGDSYEQWEIVSWTESTGTPRYLVPEYETERARLIPTPTVNDTVNLWVIRDPLDDIDDGDSEMEVADRNDQLVVLDYVKFLAYTKQDADVYDKERGEFFFTKYAAGTEKTRQRINKKRRRPGVVRYGGL